MWNSHVCHVWIWVQAMAAPRPFGVALVLLVLAQAMQNRAKQCKNMQKLHKDYIKLTTQTQLPNSHSKCQAKCCNCVGKRALKLSWNHLVDRAVTKRDRQTMARSQASHSLPDVMMCVTTCSNQFFTKPVSSCVNSRLGTKWRSSSAAHWVHPMHLCSEGQALISNWQMMWDAFQYHVLICFGILCSFCMILLFCLSTGLSNGHSGILCQLCHGRPSASPVTRFAEGEEGEGGEGEEAR